MLNWLFNSAVTFEMTAEDRFRVVMQRLDDIEIKIDYIYRALGGGAAEEQEEEAVREDEREDEADEGDADSVDSSKTA